MSKVSYIVLGGDGLERGPLTAREVRRWIAHKRLERQSPVKTPGTKDWVFLESLPEFTGDLGLKSAPKSPPPSLSPASSAAAPAKPTRPVKGGPASGSKGKVAILVLLLAAIVWVLWEQYKQHIKPH